MYSLPILPETIRVPLDEGGLPGCVAVIAPLDVEAQARWHDAWPGLDSRNAAGASLVRQQLRGIEELEMQGADGPAVAFDPADALHFRSLPVAAVRVIYAAIISRTVVGEELEKNSGSPSDSGGTSDTEN